jgi:hypothetical protein
LPARDASLHVHDLPFPEGEHLETLLPSPLFVRPLGRTNDLVADLRELGLNVDPPSRAFADLKFENLTGLVRAVS